MNEQQATYDATPKPPCAVCGRPYHRSGARDDGFYPECEEYEPQMSEADLPQHPANGGSLAAHSMGLSLLPSEREETVRLLTDIQQKIASWGGTFLLWTEALQETVAEAQRNIEARIAERDATLAKQPCFFCGVVPEDRAMHACDTREAVREAGGF